MMKCYKIVPILGICGLIMSIVSWTAGPGPTTSENSFLIDGDGFSNQLINLDIKAHEFENNFYAKAVYTYEQEYQNMTVRISGGNNVTSTAPITGVHIDFNSFTRPGIYTTDSAISFSVFFKKDIPTNEYESQYMLDSDGIVNIKTYEPIGGLMEGSFSGTFSKMIYNKKSGIYEDSDIQVKITNGKFSVIHCPDYHWDAPQSTGAEPEGFKKKKKKEKKS
jgi:hypothetical protein